MYTRRTADQLLKHLLVDPAAVDREALSGAGRDLIAYELGDADGAGSAAASLPRSEGAQGAAFLLDTGDGDAMLIVGAAARRIPRGQGGRELLGRATAGAAAWQREYTYSWKRAQLADHLIGFASALGSAANEEDVSRALAEAATRAVGSYGALVFERGEHDSVLHALDDPALPYEPGTLSLPVRPRFSRPGVVTVDDTRADIGAPLRELGPIFEAGVVSMAHVPFGKDRLLCLLERREERVFDPEDWYLMRVLTDQAEATMERVRLYKEVRNLSLTDALTGLANRRHMKVVLEHSIASARRGESLTVVLIDLDDFKRINDTEGHGAGDRLLCAVADCLREEVRGSDLVVRYGGDEFLVVLPGEDAAGARTFLQRVRQYLDGRVGISAGIAEYQPDMRCQEQLIAAADEKLYEAKHRRHSPW